MTSQLLKGLIECAGYAGRPSDALRMWERLKLPGMRFVVEGVGLQPANWQPVLEKQR